MTKNGKCDPEEIANYFRSKPNRKPHIHCNLFLPTIPFSVKKSDIAAQRFRRFVKLIEAK